MKNRTLWAAALLALMTFGCEIDENRNYGVLQLQVRDENFPLATLTLTVQVNQESPAEYTVDPTNPQRRTISLDGLSLDQPNTITLSSPLYQTWTNQLDFPAGTFEQSATAYITRLSNSNLYRTTVRTFTQDGQEVSGLPLEIDGTPVPFASPTFIELPPDTPVSLTASLGDCQRGQRVITLDSNAPGRVDTLWVEDQLLAVDGGAPETVLLLNGQAVTLENGSLLNPAPGSWLSAYRPGHVFQAGASRRLGGMCDEPAAFQWTPITEGYQLNQLFPDFTLPMSVDGSGFSLRSYRGHVVLVNFWFINCVPCQAEMPVLQDILTEHYDEGFRILALDPIEPMGQQSAWVQANPQFTIDFLADLQAPYLAAAAGVQVFPKNMLIDRRGVIRMIVGEIDEASFTAMVEQLLAE